MLDASIVAALFAMISAFLAMICNCVPLRRHRWWLGKVLVFAFTCLACLLAVGGFINENKGIECWDDSNPNLKFGVSNELIIVAAVCMGIGGVLWFAFMSCFWAVFYQTQPQRQAHTNQAAVYVAYH